MARPGQLVAAALGATVLWFILAMFAPPSYAQSAACQAIANNCDQGQAFAAAVALADREGSRICKMVGGNQSTYTGNAVALSDFQTYTAYVTCTNTSAKPNAGQTFFSTGCSSRPDWNGPYPYLTGGRPKNGSVTCNGGCKQAWYSTGDGYFNGKYTSVPGQCDKYDDKKCKSEFGSGYYWNAGMSACEPDEGKCPGGGATNSLGECKPEPCPAGMTQQSDGTCRNKENECPAGQVKSPDGKCLPGDGQCASGEARGKDGTCKKDNDGDGTPDEEEGDDPTDPGGGDGEKAPDEFSGGDNCSQPPTCSGSPVLCGQARIQWRIDCNTRKNRSIAGGMCTTPPVCTGEKCDALEVNSLVMQWRIACATEKALTQDNNSGGSAAQPEWTKVAGMSQDPGLGASPGDTKVLSVKKLSVDDLDQSGIGGGGGSCIGFSAGGGAGIASGFAQAMASPPAYFCDYIGLLRAVCILGAAVVSVTILTSGGKS